QLHTLHQNRYRLIGHRSTRPSQLSHRYRTDTRTASIPSTETARGSAEVELHHLTQSVKLFLRQPLITIARSPFLMLVNRRRTRPSLSREMVAGVLRDVSIHPEGSVTKFKGRPRVRVQTSSPSFNM